MSDSNYVVVNAIDLRQNMGDLVNRVFYQGLTVFVKRRGKVVAKLIASDKSEVPGSDRADKVEEKKSESVKVIEQITPTVPDSIEAGAATSLDKSAASDTLNSPSTLNTSSTPSTSNDSPSPQTNTSSDSSISNDSLQQLKDELRRAGYDPSYIRQ